MPGGNDAGFLGPEGLLLHGELLELLDLLGGQAESTSAIATVAVHSLSSSPSTMAARMESKMTAEPANLREPTSIAFLVSATIWSTVLLSAAFAIASTSWARLP